MAIRDLRSLSQALRIFLTLQALLILLCLWSEMMQLDLFERIAGGADISEDEADANDTRQLLVALPLVGVSVIVAVVFLRWLFLSSRNAHEVTSGMRFTPGWTVGWYFVPILWFWKPYQAMVELFRASHPQPNGDWQSAPRPAIVPVWWFLWVVTTVVNNGLTRRLFRDDTIEELITLSRLTVLSYLGDFVLAIIAVMLVARLSAFQEAKFGTLRSMRSV